MQLYTKQIQIKNRFFNVDVYDFPKRNSSATIKGDTINIRLSSRISRKLQNAHAENLLKRMIKSLEKKDPPKKKIWMDGDIIDVCEKKYVLQIHEENRKTGTVGMPRWGIPTVPLTIKIPKNLSNSKKQILIFNLIRKILAQENQIYLQNLVSEINHKYF